MKNLPETGMWDKIKSRLGSYEEEPDDNWDAIMAGVSAQGGQTTDLATKSLWVILVLLLGWLGIPEDLGGGQNGIGNLSGSLSAVVLQTPKVESTRQTISDSSLIEGKNNTPDENTISGITDSGDQAVKIDIQSHHQSAGQIFNSARKSSPYEDLTKQEDSEDETESEYDVKGGDKESGFVVKDHVDNVNPFATSTPLSEDAQDAVVEGDRNDSSVNAQIKNSETSVIDKKEETKREQRRKRPLLIYASITPSLAYYDISPDKKDEVQLKDLKSPGIFSSDRLGFALDFGLHRQVTRKIEVYAGVSYYQQHQNISYTYLSGEIKSITKVGSNYNITPGTETRRISYSMKNVGLAAGAFYMLKKATLNHQIGFGLQYHYGLSQVSNESEIRNAAVSYVNYQMLYRLRWNMSPRLDFYLQPSYTSSFTSQQNENQPFAIKPSRAGIGFGLIYFVR